MEIKLIEIRDASKVLEKIMNFPMKVKLSYRLTRIANKLQAEANQIEKIRRELINKYGIKDEKSGRTAVPKENMEEFFNVFDSELEKITVIDIDPIPFGLLIESGIDLSPADLVAIEKFVEKERGE